MFTTLSFLRGINVSGQKKIKMADLKALYESLGYARVRTYIQSGNVLFDAPQQCPDPRAIMDAIRAQYGFEVEVLNVDPADWAEILTFKPWTDEAGNVKDHVYIAYLSAEPTEANVQRLRDFDHGSGEWILKGRVIYFHCPQGYGQSKLNNNLFEAKLKVVATTRNWRTSEIMLELAREK